MGILSIIAEGIDTKKFLDKPYWHPVNFGLPDLKGPKFDQRPGELWATTYLRRASAIRKIVETYLKAIKGAYSFDIKLTWGQLEIITDCFYGVDINGTRIRKALLWKNRGGGGSLCVAVILFLKMIYDGWSGVDLAGSLEQAKQVYAYTTYFWSCIPGMDKLLDGEPRQTITKLKNGCTLACLPASEKQSRSKHLPMFVADEACQRDQNIGQYVETALQGVYSEPDHLIIWVSTYHVATGYFQELVDEAKVRKIKTYKWNVFETMEACTQGLKKYSTPEDPTARKYCMEKCPLTRRTPVYDEDGTFIRIDYDWCCGTARESDGYYTYENVLDARNSCTGDTFNVEHCCNRPVSSGPVYNPYHVQRSMVEVLPFTSTASEELKSMAQKVVGIDWGFAGETAIVGPCIFTGSTVEIVKTTFVSGVGIEDIGSILEQLKAQYGDFGIFADASHPFNIDFMITHGWEIEPVAFNKWKEYGIGNVARWLAQRKVHINSKDGGNDKLKKQMLLYYRDKNGKPEKKADHGPDALLCALLNWNFLEYFVDESEEESENLENFANKCVW